ncbi:uncharacterized protein MYCFIDRAFT_209877 [Pseudocercospora fijiensis CIRAD86]|uniref:Uncharacterized protein n=1 Tax=Pseudocercospora fijiensis (strain CIRAD86) TaxID=383855 RepID=N1Q7L6_PSEFD|nr:uncharacterized protein MYCFIDRAFT_209877 [Pseudocercospora fijiensis CIRAD86]EME88700.1 hypothetical protein MYCFIDRAFT_209877 [Pseudocercospora fijiensis CIRAD86]
MRQNGYRHSIPLSRCVRTPKAHMRKRQIVKLCASQLLRMPSVLTICPTRQRNEAGFYGVSPTVHTRSAGGTDCEPQPSSSSNVGIFYWALFGESTFESRPQCPEGHEKKAP